MEDEVYLIVKSIDLLTADEAGELPRSIRDINKWWWLQSPIINYNIVASIDDVGSIKFDGYYVFCDIVGVRPALYIEGLDDLDLPSYTELEIFARDWIYIGNNKALAKGYLWEGWFDKNSNNYKTSEIKGKLDYWLKEKKAEFNED